jgi:hypothetical protein
VLSVQGFSESAPGDIHTDFPSDGEPFTDLYDYEDDSDLEDEDDTDDVLAADRKMIRRNTVPTQGMFAFAGLSRDLSSDCSRRGESDRACEIHRRRVPRKDPAGAEWPHHTRQGHGVSHVSRACVSGKQNLIMVQMALPDLLSVHWRHCCAPE